MKKQTTIWGNIKTWWKKEKAKKILKNIGAGGLAIGGVGLSGIIGILQILFV